MTDPAIHSDAGIKLTGNNVSASCHAVGMEGRAVADTLEAMEASLAVMAAFADRPASNDASADANPIQDEADACLDGLAEVARTEARLAALKIHFATG